MISTQKRKILDSKKAVKFFSLASSFMIYTFLRHAIIP
jgi:hypothetical protein